MSIVFSPKSSDKQNFTPDKKRTEPSELVIANNRKKNASSLYLMIEKFHHAPDLPVTKNIRYKSWLKSK